MRNLINIAGNQFGLLTVIRESPRLRNGGQVRRAWDCLCACGQEVTVAQYTLTSGMTRSCGCLRLTQSASVTHGHARKGGRTKSYQSWSSMVKRCTNPKCRAYKWYGARGIEVCPSWLKFDGFLLDMGEPPEGHTIERRDVNQGYVKGNCEWIPKAKQAANKITSLRFEHLGRTQCLKDWCRELGLTYLTVYKRIQHRGWTFNEAIGVTNRSKKC